MKIWIPTIGDHIRLTEDWVVGIKPDYRNYSLLDKVQTVAVVIGDTLKTVVFPAGTVLKIERVYIRSNFRAYDSVTFRVKFCPEKKFEKTRFFASLTDVNKMEAERIEP